MSNNQNADKAPQQGAYSPQGTDNASEKKKKIKKTTGIVYLILVCVFSLVIVLDLVNLAVTSSAASMDISDIQGGMTLPDNDSFSFDSTDGESMAMPDEDFQGGDNAGSPDTAGKTDENGTMGGMNGGSGDDSFGNADSSFSMGGGRGGMAAMGGSSNEFLSTVRRFWIPILIVGIVGDALFLFLYIHARKKARRGNKDNKNDISQQYHEPTEEELEAAAKARRDRNKKTWAIVLCIVLVITIVIASLPTTTSTDESSVTVDEEILSGTASAATISTTLVGAGTLAEEDEVTVSVPSVVTVKYYYVENGDSVDEGDILASVDKTSVESAIVELQSVIDELDSDLEEESHEEAEDTITAASSGRVKYIYAQEGTAVTKTIYNSGALMLISLDGLMAVDIETDESFTINEDVTVELSDGTELDGRVSSLGSGTITVTVDDEDADYNDSVTVYDDNGNKLGTGTLYINSELKVVSYYGTVESIDVDVDDEVESGDTQITLEETGYTSTYTALLNRRYELDEQMSSLYELYNDGYIYAETSGVVSGIDDDATVATLSTSTSTAAVATAMSYTAGNSGVMAASTAGSTVGSVTSKETASSNTPTTVDDESALINYVGEFTSADGNEIKMNMYMQTIDIEDYSNITELENVDFSSSDNYAAVTYSHDENVPIYSYNTDTGEWEEISSDNLTDGDILVMSFVNDESSGDVLLWIIRVSAENDSDSDISDTTDTSNTSSTASNSSTSSQTTSSDTSSSESSQSSGEISSSGSTSTGTEFSLDTDASGMSAFGNTSGMSGMSTDTDITGGSTSGDMSGMTGMSTDTDVSAAAGDFTGDTDTDSAYDGMTEEEIYAYETYSIDEKDVITITPRDTMTIEISVDELDILQLETGLDVEVTLDAVTGQSFSGQVTEISSTGTNEGGNTKFAVTVTIDRTEQMLVGMNASVKIVTDETDASVTVPAAALVEDGGSTYIYTSYNTQEETLTGLTEVETGVSDGETVEILSGLSYGDNYYYSYAESLTYTFTNVRS